MGIKFICNITKRTATQFPATGRLPQNPGVPYRSEFLQNLALPCRSIPNRSNFSFHRRRRSYSSLPSPNQEMGFLSWYLKMLDLRPILTKSLSSSLIYAAADLTSQMGTMPVSGSIDLVRTIRMAGFGLLILGPAQHAWFNLMGRVLPKRDMVTTFKKLIVGQIFYGPAINATFLSYNAAMQGETGDEIASRLKRDLFPTIVSNLMYWPVCDFFTYKVIPVHLQRLIEPRPETSSSQEELSRKLSMRSNRTILQMGNFILFWPGIGALLQMELWGKMIFPLQKAWTRVGRRLGMKKTGLVKLRSDVKTCEYEDVHILWEMLKKKETGMTRAARGGKRGHFWSFVRWARYRAPFICRSV